MRARSQNARRVATAAIHLLWLVVHSVDILVGHPTTSDPRPPQSAQNCARPNEKSRNRVGSHNDEDHREDDRHDQNRDSFPTRHPLMMAAA